MTFRLDKTVVEYFKSKRSIDEMTKASFFCNNKRAYMSIEILQNWSEMNVSLDKEVVEDLKS